MSSQKKQVTTINKKNNPRNLKKIFSTIFVSLLSVAIIFMFVFSGFTKSQRGSTRALAIVNGTDINHNNPDFISYIKRIESKYKKIKNETVVKIALKQVIEDKLLLKAAEDNNIKVSRDLHKRILYDWQKQVGIKPFQFAARPRSYRKSVEKQLKNDYKMNAIKTDLALTVKSSLVFALLQDKMNNLKISGYIVSLPLDKDGSNLKKLTQLHKVVTEKKQSFTKAAASLNLRISKTGYFKFFGSPSINGAPVNDLNGHRQFHSEIFLSKKGDISNVIQTSSNAYLFQTINKVDGKSAFGPLFNKDKFKKLSKKKQENLKKQFSVLLQQLNQKNNYYIYKDYLAALYSKNNVEIIWKNVLPEKKK